MTEDSTDLELHRRQLKTQISNVATRRQNAVCVRRAYKRYGTKSNPCVVLDGLNMTVPKGTIYGLLGASGCGKTTLLNCIVGRKRLNNGEIWVLGGRPGSRGSGVPGPRIGYMPQEIALYGEFTIRETFQYFGWIAEMSSTQVAEKLNFYVKFLMLPDADRYVKNLSGGQQRRVSLAVALIHEPELLILDEPTVGVDPLLRKNIWDHLVEISKYGNTTVIITTHYIDETRQAHTIGLMRGGYFLAEESPERLMAHYNAESLEDVFLKLSVIQNMGKRRRSSILQSVTGTIQVPTGAVNEAAIIDDEAGEISGEFGDNVSMSSRGGRVSIAPEPTTEQVLTDIPPEEERPVSYKDYFKIIKPTHMRALIWKNFLWMWRNAPIMVFIIGLPVGQTILFCLSIGHDPKDLTLSVVNNEIDFPKQTCHFDTNCNSTILSCNYMHFVQSNYTLNMKYYSSEDDARASVVDGRSWAYLIFPSNFSDSLRSRIENGRDVPAADLTSSTVNVYADKSNENIATYIQRDLYFGFENFFQNYLSTCGIPSSIARLPIKWEIPSYGQNNPDFTNFAAPGLVLTIIFFMAVALTAGAMLLERNEGSLERSLVNGITGMEILFAHVITQLTVMIGQATFVIVVGFVAFKLTLEGSWVLLFAMTFLGGFCGMSFGFVVACVCDNERSATYMSLGSFLPFVILCGVIWPIEAMNDYLRKVAFFLPLTKATEGLRCILARGWGIDDPAVYSGFISLSIWTVIFLVLSILVLKFKKG